MQHPKKLPIQALIEENYLKIERLHKDYHVLSTIPHRHDHFELIWILDGEGEQYINFKAFPFVKNRIYLIQVGQVHLIPEFERHGWIFLMSEELIRHFFVLHPTEEGRGIFDIFGNHPFIDLDASTLTFVEYAFAILNTELTQNTPDKNIIFHQISTLLLKLNRVHSSIEGNIDLLPQDREVLLRLRKLIQSYYKQEHQVIFYLEHLGLPIKTLNQICQKTTGKTVHGLLEEKLLAEAKMLLLSTRRSIKEIAFELGFSDPAYFGRFFRRLTSTTPVSYREQYA